MEAAESRLAATMDSIGAHGATFERTTEELLGQVFGFILTQIADEKECVFIKVLTSEGRHFPGLVGR
ncbi:hypothetical protein SLH49_13245 [Cognatiyoonia sp. IB215446]|uniref:hypothetical protein n=1 Tax=Cognatiyoonia sp. IB215446 TaxID=3097355 RepID=UPI002A1087D4|nr:hypothetical protein [Cognatiyoonia sp. IB215446]MDX8348945.1 hypothetical protein [Cognatiyoonia sp. IB215446]